MLAVGVHLLHSASIITGGTVGISLLLSKVTGLPYGTLSIAVNAPLFLFGWKMMGGKFIGKSLAVTAAGALLVAWIPRLLPISVINPAFAAIAGGTIVGMGALAAARHGSAVGGSLIVALWLQRRFGVNGGSTQFAFDVIVALLAAALLGRSAALWSFMGIVAADAMIITWHRPHETQGEKDIAGVP
jgi:uncharacterized membrane-anchored protein YitT (DUF2179 family)